MKNTKKLIVSIMKNQNLVESADDECKKIKSSSGTNFSKAQYTNKRLRTLQMGCDMYPTYFKILEAKQNCYS